MQLSDPWNQYIQTLENEDAARSRIILFGGAQWSGSWSAMGDVCK
jgi:hypothetical protein